MPSNLKVNLNDAFFDDENFMKLFALGHEMIVMVMLAGRNAVDDVIQDGVSVRQVREEWNLLQRILDELHVPIAVLEDTFFDILQDLGIIQADVIKVFLSELSDHTVLFGNDGSSSGTVIDH